MTQQEAIAKLRDEMRVGEAVVVKSMLQMTGIDLYCEPALSGLAGRIMEFVMNRVALKLLDDIWTERYTEAGYPDLGDNETLLALERKGISNYVRDKWDQYRDDKFRLMGGKNDDHIAEAGRDDFLIQHPESDDDHDYSPDGYYEEDLDNEGYSKWNDWRWEIADEVDAGLDIREELLAKQFELGNSRYLENWGRIVYQHVAGSLIWDVMGEMEFVSDDDMDKKTYDIISESFFEHLYVHSLENDDGEMTTLISDEVYKERFKQRIELTLVEISVNEGREGGSVQ